MPDPVREPAGPAAVQAADASDAAAIARLHGRLFAPPWSDLEVRDLMAHAGAAAFVCRAAGGGQLGGYVLGRVAADEAEVLSIGVDPEARRRGLGLALLGALAERAAGMGAARLYLEVSAVNAPAIALYERCGFTRLGLRRGYYREPGRPAEDALLLGRDLVAKPRVD